MEGGPAIRKNARYGFIRDDGIQERLVVLAHCICRWVVFTNKRRLAHQGFKHRRRRLMRNAVGLGDHVYESWTPRRDEIIIEIAPHAIAQRSRLADVQDFASLLKEIDARTIRQVEFRKVS